MHVHVHVYLFSLPRYSRDATYHSIVYRHSDIRWEALQGAWCGLSDDSSLMQYLHHSTQRRTAGEGVSPVEVGQRRRRQGGRDRDLVRCDLSVTGDYKFFEEVSQNVDSVEEKISVAASLLVSYVQGASRIFQVIDYDVITIL